MPEADTRHTQRLVVHRTGRARDVTMQGRAYKVFPARLVQEQVLNNNLGATFLPAAEIAASAPAWNATPVVERHPMRNGAPLSARSPEVLDQVGLGFVFNARADGAALLADIYLDAERVAALPDTAGYVANAENGEAGELSTGFAANITPQAGTHNGREYAYVLTNLAPDHLALLPDERGACSVADGCGLGVNAAVRNCGGSCKCGGGAATATTTEPTLGEDGAVTLSDAVPVRRVTLYQPTANADGTHPSEETLMNREQMIERLVANGTPEAVAKGLTDDQLATLCSAKPTATNADPDAAEALRIAHEYRAKYEALQNAAAPAMERETRERAEMIDDLVFNEARHAFNEKEIRGMDLPMLRRLHKTVFGEQNFAGRGGPVTNASGADYSFARRGILSGDRGKSVLDRSEG
jgi:hypothetical protein